MVQISIITPVYNSVQFIESCIKNVIDQKCEQAEHIIIDGGSTDGTLEIIQNYATRYSHIRWVSEKDKGQSDAMNKGIKMAQGEIISFLNADDGYFTYTLNRIINIYNNPKLNFITGNCKLFDNNGNLIYINRPKRIKNYHLFSYQEPFPINPSAYFYKKSIHYHIGYYNINNHYNMDYEFILKACLYYNLIYFNEDWGYAIQHPKAKTYNDIAMNEMGIRKKNLFDSIYNEVPLKVRISSTMYKFYKKIRVK